MSKITRIQAREILDSRGNPTVEVSVLTGSGAFGTASSPSGTVTGKNEAIEVRDGDPGRYHGMGMQKTVENVNRVLAPKLLGLDIEDQAKIDKTMNNVDDTDNKARMGVSGIYAISMAATKAAAALSGIPLFLYLHNVYNAATPMTIPAPIFNLINGGKHGAGNLDFQEFHIIPSTRYPFAKALQIGSETHYSLKNELIHRNAIHSVGDEGGFAPNLFTNTDAIELLSLVIKNSPYRLNGDIFLGLDVAANTFYDGSHYKIKDSPHPLDRDEMIKLYTGLIRDYNIFAIEDGLSQDDWKGWELLKRSVSDSTLIVGDDLITTNKKSLEKAIESKAINAVVVKPNQIGTVTETVELVQLAKKSNIFTIATHRSGETNDCFIADLAVGLGLNFAKFGAPNRGERIAKYNRLLEIETYLTSTK